MHKYNYTQFINVLIIIVLIVFAFGPSVFFPLSGDDITLIKENPYIENFHNIDKIFSSSYFTISHGENSFRPIATFSYFLMHQLVNKNSIGLRLANLILYIFCCLLVYFLLGKIFNDKLMAFLATVIFALHPTHVEVINYVTFNEDILVTIFIIFAFYFYTKYLHFSTNVSFYCYAVIFYLLGLFSKEVTIVFPIIMVFYDWWRCVIVNGQKYRLIKFLPAYLGFGIITFFYIWCRFYYLKLFFFQKHAFYAGGTFFTNLLTIPSIFLHYLKNLMFPIDLQNEYYIHPIINLLNPRFLFFFTIILVLFLTIWFLRYRIKIIFFFSGWIFLTILPVLNIVPFLHSYLAADRYVFLPSVGFSFIIAVLFKKIYNFRKSFFYLIFVSLVLYYFNTGVSYSTLWGNPIELNLKLVKKFPNQGRTYRALGRKYKEMGELSKAIEAYKKSATIEPKHNISIQIAELYTQMENYELAADEYRKVLNVLAGDIEIISRLKYIYMKLEEKKTGKNPIKTLEMKIKENPGNLSYRYQLAYQFYQFGLWNMAIEQYKEIQKLDPNTTKNLDILAACYMYSNQVFKAKKIYAKILNNNIDPAILRNIGNMYYKLGKLNKALCYYEKFIKLEPQNTDIFYNFGIIYIRQKKYEKALYYLKLIEKNEPDAKNLQYLLGITYYSLDLKREALQYLEKANQIYPNDVAIQKKIKLIRKRF